MERCRKIQQNREHCFENPQFNKISVRKINKNDHELAFAIDWVADEIGDGELVFYSLV